MAIIRPIADGQKGLWTPSAGNDLYACVDETSASDTDHISTEDSGGKSAWVHLKKKTNTPINSDYELDLRSEFLVGLKGYIISPFVGRNSSNTQVNGNISASILGGYSGWFFDGSANYFYYTDILKRSGGFGFDIASNTVVFFTFINYDVSISSKGIFSIGTSPTDGGPESILYNDVSTLKSYLNGNYSTLDVISNSPYVLYSCAFTYTDFPPYNSQVYLSSNRACVHTVSQYLNGSLRSVYFGSSVGNPFKGLCIHCFVLQGIFPEETKIFEMLKNPWQVYKKRAKTVYFLPNKTRTQLQLWSTTDPGVDTGHVLRYRGSGDFTARIKSGTATIAEWAESLGSLTTVERTLTEGQAAAITDYSDLRVEFDT